MMADLARRIATIGWGAPNDPKPGHVTCSRCRHAIVQGRPIFMMQDQPYCSSAHRTEAYKDECNLFQPRRRTAPISLVRTASQWTCTESSLVSEWHDAFHVCD